MVAAAPGERSGDGVHGAILAAGLVRVGSAFSTALDPSVEDPGAARAQTGLPGRAALGRPLALRRSGGELHPRGRAEELALADPDAGGFKVPDHGSAESGGRAAGTRRY